MSNILILQKLKIWENQSTGIHKRSSGAPYFIGDMTH
jgi:hypothetical protein